MRFGRCMKYFMSLAMIAIALAGVALFAQETTGGLQGTVKDSSGAVVVNAHVEVKGSGLVGSKSINTDSAGYYRFANLPPGTYAVTVSAKGFKTVKRDNIVLEVGHLPSLDLILEVGATGEVVEVSGAAPLIDTTTQTTLTNVTSDVIKDVPHGYSFQSVIQFAPGARNEPLAGGAVGPNAAGMGGNGTGGQSAGSGTNGQTAGYSIGGGADAENSYLVEGQETADAIGGFSHTNVPFSFIQEVQVKSSGVDAEYGGALGGVVNVIMQKGSNRFHGSVFSQFESGSWDGSPNEYPRYDPTFVSPNPSSVAFLPDATYQAYQPKRDSLQDYFPGFTIGGPIMRDKLWFFASFNPEFRERQRTVNWNWPGSSAFPTQTGPTTFSTNQQTYYSNARIDWAATQKIRVFGSWLYEYQRQTGEFLPFADAINPAFVNGTATSPPEIYGHNLGYGAPNTTTNLGADVTLTPRIVATFRWGYNFQNYHDFGMPTGSFFDAFAVSGVGANDNLGHPIPASSQLSQIGGFFSAPNNINNTTYDVTHHNQINAELAVFKSGWAGTHNIKFGYQLNRLSNAVEQHFNEPNVTVYPGQGQYIQDFGGPYAANCNLVDPGGHINPANGAWVGGPYGGCAGQYGYIYLYDYGSLGQATSMNHALFVQDAWTIGHGITLNAGVRIEREYLPAENQPQGGISHPINFGWGDKIAPRIGAAWDVLNNGKWKVFGSYGKFYDIMKLNLAISSFNGQYWNNCYYALNTQDLSSIAPVFSSSNRYCGGPGATASTPGNFGGTNPAGITFIENQNFRTFPTTCSTCTLSEEGVAPGLKPYTQHESVFGLDHQISGNLALEVRWDRRRLDHVIEDAALYNPNIGETFVIVNPGQGVNRTFDGFWNFLYGSPSGCAPAGTAPNTAAGQASCPSGPPLAIRSYDGVEFRLTKATSHHWAGMFSYTYSHFRGNYTGLTNTDISDGGGGRNAPNNSRAFDEPYFYYDAAGQLSNGLLPTDRPSVFKGYAYYELGWLKKFTTNFGIFQYLYQGSPVGSFADVGNTFAPSTIAANGVISAEGGAFPTYLVPRGQFLPISQDPNTGAITVGAPYTRRTPWFTQSDVQLTQGYKLSETKTLNFSVTVPNVLNQHSVTAYWQNMDTGFYPQFIAPASAACGAILTPPQASAPCTQATNGYQFYTAAMSGYNLTSVLNHAAGTTGTNGAMAVNSIYNQPLFHQFSRNLYMAVKFTF